MVEINKFLKDHLFIITVCSKREIRNAFSLLNVDFFIGKLLLEWTRMKMFEGKNDIYIRKSHEKIIIIHPKCTIFLVCWFDITLSWYILQTLPKSRSVCEITFPFTLPMRVPYFQQSYFTVVSEPWYVPFIKHWIE